MTNYHYEFGIFAARRKGDDEGDYKDEDYKESRMVVDMREVVSFYKIPESMAPNGTLFKNITSVTIRHADVDSILYYPYKLFKQLFMEVMDISTITTLPYPVENNS